MILLEVLTRAGWLVLIVLILVLLAIGLWGRKRS
jgi:hypothetical protein